MIHGSFRFPSVRNFFRALIFWLYICTTLYTYVKAEGSSGAGCKVTGVDSQQYDLSPLTKTSKDWEVEPKKDFNYKFKLNVCKATIDTPEEIKQKDLVGIWDLSGSSEGGSTIKGYLVCRSYQEDLLLKGA
ncbi:2877_t:CDS:2, partial [Racocetra persica]